MFKFDIFLSHKVKKSFTFWKLYCIVFFFFSLNFMKLDEKVDTTHPQLVTERRLVMWPVTWCPCGQGTLYPSPAWRTWWCLHKFRHKNSMKEFRKWLATLAFKWDVIPGLLNESSVCWSLHPNPTLPLSSSTFCTVIPATSSPQVVQNQPEALQCRYITTVCVFPFCQELTLLSGCDRKGVWPNINFCCAENENRLHVYSTVKQIRLLFSLKVTNVSFCN